MNIEDKKTSFVNPRFGVRGVKGLSKATDKIFRSESMKKLNRIKNGDLGNPIVRTELMKVMESVATDIWHTKLCAQSNIQKRAFNLAIYSNQKII